MADAGQIILNLLFFVIELLFIRKMLPSATAADTKVMTGWFYTVWRRVCDRNSDALHIASPLSDDPDINYVARNHAGHKQDHIIDPGNGITL
jgi:hypothetical protein